MTDPLLEAALTNPMKVYIVGAAEPDQRAVAVPELVHVGGFGHLV